jgi:hypothetical protein
MATIQERASESYAPDQKVTGHAVSGHNIAYRVMALVLAALVGFGIGWLVFNDSGVDVPSEVSDVLDGYTSAWNNGDGAAAAGYMTMDGVHSSSFVPDGLAPEDLAIAIDNLAPGVFVEDVKYVSVSGDTEYVVVQSGTTPNGDGYSVFRLVHVGDELKIAVHAYYDN